MKLLRLFVLLPLFSTPAAAVDDAWRDALIGYYRFDVALDACSGVAPSGEDVNLLETAIAEAEHAIALAPDYGLAHAMLAHAVGIAYMYLNPAEDPVQRARVIEHAEAAVKLGANHALTMVFAGPPEDDVDWADVSPAGSAKFLNRAWRLAGDVTSQPGVDFATGDLALRKAAHKALHDISFAVESFRFNVAVARVMELVNATRKAIDSGCGPADPAVREATEIVAISLSLIAPYTAEEMWEKLGHKPSVALAGWPSVDPALLTQDSVTAIFQVNGKIKSRVDISPDTSDTDLEKMAFADPAVIADLAGQTPKKVITKSPKFVNIVL